MYYRISCVALLLFLIASCSTSQFGWKSESGSEKKSSQGKGYVEDFDPLTLEEEDIVVSPQEKSLIEKDEEEPVNILMDEFGGKDRSNRQKKIATGTLPDGNYKGILQKEIHFQCGNRGK